MTGLKKRLLGAGLALAMVAAMVPFSAFAQETTADNSAPASASEPAPLADGANGVAQVGGTTYATLEDAIAAAVTNNSITLLDNVTLDGELTIDHSVYIDMAGHTISSTSGGIRITGGSVIFQNGQFQGFSSEAVLLVPADAEPGTLLALHGIDLKDIQQYGVKMESGTLNTQSLSGTTYRETRFVNIPENGAGIVLGGAGKPVTANMSDVLGFYNTTGEGTGMVVNSGATVNGNTLRAETLATTLEVNNGGSGDIDVNINSIVDIDQESKSTPSVRFVGGAANASLSIRNYSLAGGFEVTNCDSTDQLYLGVGTCAVPSKGLDLNAYDQVLGESSRYSIAPIFTLVFDNQGVGPTPEPMKVSALRSYQLPNPAVEGYVIRGWYMDKATTYLPWDVSTSAMSMGPEANRTITLYAKWTYLITTGGDVGPAPEVPAATPVPTPAPTPIPTPAPTRVPAPPVEEEEEALPTSTPVPDAPVLVTTTTVTATVTENKASAVVSEEELDDVITQSIENAAAEAAVPSVEIQVDAQGAEAVDVTLPAAALARLGETAGAQLTMKSDVAQVTFDNTAIAAIAGQANEAVTLAVEPVAADTLNDTQKMAVGNAPVFELTLQSGDTRISAFNGGTATVTLPYTLTEGQVAEGIVVWYVDDIGNITPCTTTYDAAAGQVVFETSHFSKYAVGYQAPPVEEKPETEVAPEQNVTEPTQTASGSSVPFIPILVVVTIVVLIVLAIVIKRVSRQ